MHFKKELITMIIQIVILFKHRNFQLPCAFTIFQDK